MNVKLTPEDVIEIRKLKGVIPLKELSIQFGVHITTIRAITSGRNWKKLKDSAE